MKIPFYDHEPPLYSPSSAPGIYVNRANGMCNLFLVTGNAEGDTFYYSSDAFPESELSDRVEKLQEHYENYPP
jgi:hypothetical protein